MQAKASMSKQCRILLGAPSSRMPAAAPLLARRRPVVVPVRFMGGERDFQSDPIVVYTSIDPSHGGLSPFSQSVLMALLEKQLPFREVRIDLGKKSPEFTDLYHSVIPSAAKRVRAPLLVDGPTLLVESPVIIDYLQRCYKSGAQLLPENNAAAEAKVKLFMQYFSENVVPPYEKLLHVSNEVLVNDAREELMDALECLDSFMNVHGSGAADYALGPHFGWQMHSGAPSKLRTEGFFLGPFFSLAEVATTPYVNRMVNLLPEWRGVDVLQEASKRRLPRLVQWMEASLERPSAKMTDVPAEDLVNGMIDREWSRM